MSPNRLTSPSLHWAIAVALGLGLAACSKDEPAPAAPPAAAPAGPSVEEQAAKQAAEQQAAALAALTPEELKKRGSEALREQRLYAPAGDNAMEYYIALRKKSEKPDPSAESALIDLQPYAVIAAEQAIGREDFVEAERLRSLIATADPQAPALPRIADAIEKGKVAAANRATEEAARLAAQAKAAEEAKLKAAQAAAAAAAAPPPVAAPAPAATQPRPATTNASTANAGNAGPAAAAPAAAPPPAPVAAPVRNLNAIVPVSTPQPAFPPEALRAGTQGEVVVTFTVDTDGSVSNIDIVSAKPRGVFERNVQAAVRRWKYEPVQSPQTVTRTFNFTR